MTQTHFEMSNSPIAFTKFLSCTSTSHLLWIYYTLLLHLIDAIQEIVNFVLFFSFVCAASLAAVVELIKIDFNSIAVQSCSPSCQ